MGDGRVERVAEALDDDPEARAQRRKEMVVRVQTVFGDAVSIS
jgi:hypothetical protein